MLFKTSLIYYQIDRNFKQLNIQMTLLKKNGFSSSIQTSAKTGQGLKELFYSIIELLFFILDFQDGDNDSKIEQRIYKQQEIVQELRPPIQYMKVGQKDFKLLEERTPQMNTKKQNTF
ncbi:hypothetical protein pb186bvf_004410 [Paramecium bursaria]